MPIVFDASVALSLAFADERSVHTEAIVDRVVADGAIVPAHWPAEIASGLLSGERRGRIAPHTSDRFLLDLSSMSIRMKVPPPDDSCALMLSIGREQTVSAYDAAYLHLAMSESLPLATFDRNLRRAARGLGLDVLPAEY
ncbi:MAG: PIN domain-containing protein [Chloroflexota bacterium]|nr:MAG: PIN domain-containing protein [Chloroflexota bacterium]